MICEKTRYASEQAALEDIERIQKKSTRSKVPVRAYLCGCGSWHLTSKLSKGAIAIIIQLKETLVNREQDIIALKAENELLRNNHNSDDRVKVRADKRVIELTNQVAKLKQDIKRLRNDKNTLFSTIVKMGGIDMNDR